MTEEQHREAIAQIEDYYRATIPGWPLIPNGRNGESGVVAYAVKSMRYAQLAQVAIDYFSALVDCAFFKQTMPDLPVPVLRVKDREARRFIRDESPRWHHLMVR